MSIKRMSAVWDASEHSGSRLLLMLALADNANDIGVCWPGYQYISTKIRMSRRQTIRLVEACNASGELWTLNREDQRSNIYVVTVGLTRNELESAREQAVKMGAVTTMGSDKMSLPPQVLGVIRRGGDKMSLGGDKLSPGSDIAVSPGSDIAVSLGSDIAVSPDPSLTVNEPPGSGNGAQGGVDWAAVLRALRPTMTLATYNAHLLGSRAVEEDGHLTIYTRNVHSPDWLERLRRPIEQAVQARAEGLVEVVFEAGGQGCGR